MNTQATPTQPPAADERFTHMVVALTTYCNGVGTAYMIGTKQECRLWIMANGMRASTEIIPF